MLLLVMVLVGTSTTWAAEADVTYDFTGSDWTVSDGTLSNGTVSFSGQGGASFKMNTGYFILGKSGAYINFPTYSSAVEKIVVTGRSGASGSVKQNIYVGDNAVSTETTGATGTNTYTIASGYQTAGTQYTLKVTSNHNTQITKIEVYFASASSLTPIATIGDLATTKLNFKAEGKFSVDVTPASLDLVDGEDYELTWSSSDEDVLYVESDGTYLAGETKGKVDVTATVTALDGDTYSDVSKTFSIKIVDPNANDGSEAKPFTVAEAINETPSNGTSENVYIKGVVSDFYAADIVSDGTNYRYYISDDGTTTNQLLVYKGTLNGSAFSTAEDLLIGDEVIVYGGLTMYNQAPEIASGNNIVDLKRVVKADPELSFGTVTEFTNDLLLAFTAPTLTYAEGFDGTVTYSSSNEDVATVNAETGVVTLQAVGTTIITAASAATENFNPGSASYTLNVTVNPGVDPVGPAGSGDKYVKVTSADDITDGQYLIVYETDEVAFNGGLETLDAASNTVSVEIDNSEIAATTNTQAAEFTINATTGTIKSKSGYYIGVTSYGNALKQTDVDNDAYENTIEIDENENAVISIYIEGKTANTTGTMILNYNSDSNQKRFRYYKGGSQKAVQLYKYVPGEPAESFDVAIGTAGWRTLVTSVDATLPEDLTAYVVTEYTDEKATLTEVASVKANNAYLLKGAKNNYTLTVTESVSEPAVNLLKISDATTGNGVYVLANKSNGVGFYRWAGGSLGAGRVYLDAPNAAREFIGFGIDETTAIEGVAANVLDGQFFDLQGRRVAQPQKGLYIVNGKKVVIK